MAKEGLGIDVLRVGLVSTTPIRKLEGSTAAVWPHYPSG